MRRWAALAAVVVSVSGCVGMPSNGPAEQTSASPQSSSAPNGSLIGVVPEAPQPDETPSQIVQGFLTASANYPSYAVAQEYLASSAVKTWNPGFAVKAFSELTVPNTPPAASTSHGPLQQTVIDVTGTVQASFDGSGQYVSAQSQNQSQSQTPGITYPFTLVKVNGQWRITDPPSYRMVPSYAFPLFYTAQDLYFFDPQDQVLVPDSVFVPRGATLLQLIDNLVDGLTQDPKTPWLVNATDTELPGAPATRVQASTDGSIVTVNLVGNVARNNPKLPLFAAQLVWTLTRAQDSPPYIQAVVLELNGQPWTPPKAPCSDGRSPGGLQQTLAAYECYDPSPSSPTSFYYIDSGQVWARCGSVSLGQQGLIGPVTPVVSRTGSLTSQRCTPDDSVHEGYTGLPSAQTPSLPAVSMAAVSPDGKNLAIVSAAKDDVYAGSLSGPVASFLRTSRPPAGSVTALSWDRNGNLWVVNDGDIEMLTPSGKRVVAVPFAGNVSDLAVAPDGVRIAFIAVPPGSQTPELYIAAIGGGAQGSAQLGSTGSTGTHWSIRSFASIGPNVADPASLAWYDADNLIVLGDTLTGNSLYEVPVDGQQAQVVSTPPGVISITAGGSADVLVAGLAQNTLEVSTGLEGPWVPLGAPGQQPAYPG